MKAMNLFTSVLLMILLGIFLFVVSSYSQSYPGTPTITDQRDGKVYSTVQIGSQCWLQKNMNYQTGKSWCYEESSSNCETYGRLYDWKSALKVCPLGWHLPSSEEWTTLIVYLGGDSLARGKMKETGTAYWNSPNIRSTNESGFTVLPGGYRTNDGVFRNLGSCCGFWSSSVVNLQQVGKSWLSIFFRDGDTGSLRYAYYKTVGLSVRCIKD